MSNNQTISGTLDVTGATTLRNTLVVTSATTLNGNVYILGNITNGTNNALGSNYINRNTYITKVFKASGTTFTVDSPSTFSKPAQFTSDVSFGKPVKFNGAVTFAYFPTVPVDKITGLNMIPGNLGTAQNLDVSINAVIRGKLDVSGNTLIRGMLDVSGGLDVSGASRFANDVSFIGQRVDICGNFYAQYPENSIPQTAIIGGVGSDQFTTDVYMSKTLKVDQAVTFGDKLTVKGDVSFNGQRIDVCGNFYAQYPPDSIPQSAIIGGVGSNVFTSDVIMNQSARVRDMLTVDGDASFNSGMKVNGQVTLQQGMSVTNKATFNADVDICGNLAAQFVPGSIPPSAINGGVLPANTFTNDVTMNRSLIIGDMLTVLGDVSFNNGMKVNGPVTLQQGVSVTNKATFKDVDICGNFFAQYPPASIPPSAINGGVLLADALTNDVTVGRSLIVNQSAIVNDMLTVLGDASFNNGMKINGPVNLKALSVTNKATFNADVDICGNLAANFLPGSILPTAINGGVLTAETLANDVTLPKSLTVLDGLTSSGDILLRGPVTLQQGMAVTNKATFNSDVDICGNLAARFADGSISSTAISDGALSTRVFINDISLNKRLFVGENATFNENAYINKDLTVNGRLMVKQYTDSAIIRTTTNEYVVIVTEDLSVNGNIVIENSAKINSLTVLNDISTNGLLNVNGVGTSVFLDNVDICGNLTANFANDSIPLRAIPGLTDVVAKTTNAPNITEDVSLNKRLFVNGDISSGGLLYVNGAGTSTIVGGLTVDGFIFGKYNNDSIPINAVIGLNTAISNITNVNEDMTIGKRLFVTSDISSGGLLYVNGAGTSTIVGGLTVNGVLTAKYNVNDISSSVIKGLDASLNKIPNVFEDISLNKRLFVNSDISSGGLLHVNGVGTSVFLDNVDICGNLTANFANDSIPLTAIPGLTDVVAKTTNAPNITEDVSLNKRLFVNGDISSGGLLYVNASVGDSRIKSNLTVDGFIVGQYQPGSIPTNAVNGLNTAISNITNVLEDISLNKRLFVTSDISSGGLLYINGTGNSKITSGLIVGTLNADNITVSGDLTVNGTTTSLNTTNLGVKDSLIELSSGLTTGTNPINDSGILINRGNQNNVFMGWNETNKTFTLGETTATGTSTGGVNVTVGTLVAKLNSDLVDINGGTIDNTSVGSSVASSGKFTSIETSSDVSMNSRLFVGGDVTLNGRVDICGNLYAKYPQNSIPQSAIIGGVGSNSFSGDVLVEYKLAVTNDVSMNTKLSVGGDVSMNSKLSVGGDVSMNSKLSVGGDVTMNSKISVGGAVTMSSRLLVDDDVSMNSRLYVKGETKLGGPTNCTSDIGVNGLTLGRGGGNISSNTAFGGGALQNNVSGSDNTAIGYSASLSNNTGSQNISIGSDAAKMCTSGNDNIAIGVQSLSINTGSQNIGIGTYAGLTQNSGTKNTFLGYYADSANGPHSNSTAIGAHAIITASNQITLGTETETVYVPGSTLLVGDVSMNTKLSVGGDVSMNSNLFVGGDASMNSRLFIGGEVTLNGRVDICGNLFAKYPANSIPQTAIIGGVGSNSFSGDVLVEYKLAVTNDVSMNTKLSVGGDVSMNSKLLVGGDVSMNTKLSVGGDVSMNSNLSVGGDVSMNTKLSVGGDVSMNSKLLVMGDVSMNTKLSVGGDVSMNSKLSVGGAVILKDRVDICGNLYATYPNDSIPQTAIIGGVGSNIFTADVSMNTKLSVGGDVSMNSKLLVGGDVSMNTKLSVGGDVSMNSKLLVGGDVSMNTKLSVGGDVSMNSNLSVGGAVILKDRVDICGNLYATYPNDSIPQTAIIGGVGSNNFTADVSMNQKLSVGGDVSMNSKLYVKGETILDGATSSTGDISVYGVTIGRGAGGRSNLLFGTNPSTNINLGDKNILIGDSVLLNSITSNQIIAIGNNAGNNHSIGDRNIFLGHNADIDGSQHYNSTAIGAYAKITASNQITLGTAAETVNVPGLVSVAGDITTQGNIIMNGGSLRTTDSTETVTLFDTASTINLGGTSTNIFIGTGTGTSTTVTIGANNDTVNILGNLNITGTTTTISAVNLDISDNAITLNKGGLAPTFAGAGINIEDNGVFDAGYIRVDADRGRFAVRLPNLAGGVEQYMVTKDGANDLSANNFTTNGNFTMAGSGSLLMTGKYIKQF